MMIDALLDAFSDTLRILPFLFAAFLLLEAIEHYAANTATVFFPKSEKPALSPAQFQAASPSAVFPQPPPTFTPEV